MIIIYWFSWQFYEGFAVVKSSESSGEDSGSGGGGVGSYHKWFIRAVAKWLDMALAKAIGRIVKAVEIDDLKRTVDDLVPHTSSAVDIRTVIGQIETFWRQLRWPDAETAYVFISR